MNKQKLQDRGKILSFLVGEDNTRIASWMAGVSTNIVTKLLNSRRNSLPESQG